MDLRYQYRHITDLVGMEIISPLRIAPSFSMLGYNLLEYENYFKLLLEYLNPFLEMSVNFEKRNRPPLSCEPCRTRK